MISYQSRFYTINDVSLHVVEAGDKSFPTILFLHGFPSFWYSWQRQIEYFASRNFYVVVPDGRGYNTSSKPGDVSSYRLPFLVDDVVQLLSLLRVQQTYIVAHDWGGILAWALLKIKPELFFKAVIISAPYLPSFAKFSVQQLLKSWYVYFFQLPLLPEWLIKRNNFALLENIVKKTSLPDTFSTDDIRMYKEAWQQKGSITAMINWYRALAKYRSEVKQFFGKKDTLKVPVLLLWGVKDKFLTPESGICPAKHCEHFIVKRYEEATHWLPLEKSEEVNDDIFHFFTS